MKYKEIINWGSNSLCGYLRDSLINGQVRLLSIKIVSI